MTREKLLSASGNTSVMAEDAALGEASVSA